MFALRLRWALRDARARWIQFTGIALMIAVGVGMSAALTSTTEWRLTSIDAGLESTNMYDIRARVSGDGAVLKGGLLEVVRGIEAVEAAEERLISPTLVDVEIDGQSELVFGRIVGTDLAGGSPAVNGVLPVAGRGIQPSEAGQAVVLIERGFATYHGLPPEGELRIGGAVGVRYVGHAVSPEYFFIAEGPFSRTNFAAVFTTLETAQQVAGRPGMVNDLVVSLAAGADPASVEEMIRAEASRLHPGTHVELSRPIDDWSYSALVETPELDHQIFVVFAVLLFAGAALATLNFSGRMVEAQRREIGGAMALGQNPAAIAVRPLLVGVQIGGLGVVFGLVLGELVGRQLSAAYAETVSLPAFLTPFQAGIFARVAIIGFLVPVAAVLWPVIRAVRVQPVEAIRTGHLASRSGGLSPVISRIPLPGGSLARMPLRSLVRAPRRTLLTLLALSGVLAMLFSTIGMRDSLASTIEQGNTELLGDAPERLIVTLDGFYPIDSPAVSALVDGGALSDAELGLSLPGEVQSVGAAPESAEDEAVLLGIRFVNFDSETWRPSASEGQLSVAEPGIVLSTTAAEDLDVAVGDSVAVSHSARTGPGAFVASTSTLEVLALHPHPLRSIAYMHIEHAGLWGFEGLANDVTGVPTVGGTVSDARRALFGAEGVAIVQGFKDMFATSQDTLEQMSGVILLAELAGLGLALLIAFNTANLNAEERARDHATMFAYGVPLRRVVANLSAEGLLLGLLAIVAGVVFGYAILLWMVTEVFRGTFAEVGFVVSVDLVRVAVSMFLAIVVITVAPTFTARKLRRMNIPSTLRVQE